jgi:hypothetical protein
MIVFLVAVAPPAFAVTMCTHAGTTVTVDIDPGGSAIVGIDSGPNPNQIIFDPTLRSWGRHSAPLLPL